MRLPDLSQLRLGPQADARREADDEDATGAFAAQVEAEYVDCRAERRLSVRTQVWKRFVKMAERNKHLLDKEDREAQIRRERRARGVERARSREALDEEEEDSEEPEPLRTRPHRERYLQGIDYANSDDGASVCTLCSTEIAAGFAKDDSEDAIMQLRSWNDAINTEFDYYTIPTSDLSDSRGGPHRYLRRAAPRKPITDPKLRIPVPEEWKDGETCVEITNEPLVPPGAPGSEQLPCITRGPLVCYHKACILIAMKKWYDDGATGNDGNSSNPYNYRPPNPATTDWPDFVRRAHVALGEDTSFLPPNKSMRFDWLFVLPDTPNSCPGYSRSNPKEYFLRPRGSDEPSVEYFVSMTMQERVKRSRIQHALTMRGPVMPVNLCNEWALMLHRFTQRDKDLNRNFPECRRNKFLDNRILPRSGLGKPYNHVLTGAFYPAGDSPWERRKSATPGVTSPRVAYDAQFEYLLSPENEGRRTADWMLSTLIDGTMLAPSSAVPNTQSCTRAETYRNYLTDVSLSRRASPSGPLPTGVGALQVTVAFPVRLTSVSVGRAADGIRMKVATADVATRPNDQESYKGHDFDVFIRPGFATWANFSEWSEQSVEAGGERQGSLANMEYKSMFSSDNPYWENIENAVNLRTRRVSPIMVDDPGFYKVYDFGQLRDVQTNANVTTEDPDAENGVAHWWSELEGRAHREVGARMTDVEKRAFSTGIKMTLPGRPFQDDDGAPRGGHDDVKRVEARILYGGASEDVYVYGRECINRVMKASYSGTDEFNVLDAVANHLTRYTTVGNRRVQRSGDDQNGAVMRASKVRMFAWSDPALMVYEDRDAPVGPPVGVEHGGRAHFCVTVYYVRF